MQRPYWFPDTQGFLALGIIIVVSALAFLLLGSSTKFDDKIAGAFMTLLGVLTACLKDVYGFYFGSSQGSKDKDQTIAVALNAPAPVTSTPKNPTP